MSIKGQTGQQLAMFMTARELHDGSTVVPGDVEANYSAHEMWSDKNKHNDDAVGDSPTFSAQVSSVGVLRPVSVIHYDDGGSPVLSDGHHRVQAAYDHNPDTYVPVSHQVSRYPR